MTKAGPILLVEDDRDIRESLVEALEDEGYEVVPAIDGVDALDRLRQGTKPRLVLLDLMMPRMSGAELREEMARVDGLATIPIVVITADAQARAKAEALGAAEFLKKPLRLRDLFKLVARFIDRS